MPVVQPIGGHAVYLDAGRLLPHIDPLAYPGQALAIALYEMGGVRGCEIGSVMFGKPQPDGSEVPAAMELVRLAIPRRVYTTMQLNYVADAVKEIHEHRDSIRGLELAYEAPVLRHFTAHFEWL